MFLISHAAKSAADQHRTAIIEYDRFDRSIAWHRPVLVQRSGGFEPRQFRAETSTHDHAPVTRERHGLDRTIKHRRFKSTIDGAIRIQNADETLSIRIRNTRPR